MWVPGMTIRALFAWLRAEKDGFGGTYEGLKSYVKSNGIAKYGRDGGKAHPRFETGPGEQLQVDWKEGLRMTLKSGEEVEFNVFSATPGLLEVPPVRLLLRQGRGGLPPVPDRVP
jgi:hypothetical protein